MCPPNDENSINDLKTEGSFGQRFRAFRKKVLPVEQMLVTGVTVGTALHVFGNIQTLLQAGVNSIGSMPRFSVLFAAGLANTLQASVFKNAAISQHGVIHETVKDKVGTTPVHKKQSIFTSSAIHQSLTCSTIAMIDTALTHPFSIQRNLKVLASLEKFSYFNRIDRSWKNLAKMSHINMGLKFSRNFIGVMGCIAANDSFQEIANNIISSENHPIANKLFKSIFSGAVVSSVTTPLDVISTCRLQKMNPQTLAVPSVSQVSKALVAEEGFSRLWRGISLNMVSTTIAFFLILEISDYYSKLKIENVPANKPRP